MSDHTPKDNRNPNFMNSLDQFFQQTFRQLPNQFWSQSIPVHVDEQRQQFVITADLPGVQKQQIELLTRYQSLIIRVDQHTEQTTIDEDTTAVSKQRSSSHRERRIPVPFSFSDDDIHAQFENGQLIVTIADKRKAIPIR
ncbi:heat shock protein class I [Bacillus sp. JCM 19046]|nr:heat shock protein class I [Bacillus sp. JCM 19045]GAF19764.1 heat shock protein class I [Bacillus sp. JCM 19046]